MKPREAIAGAALAAALILGAGAGAALAQTPEGSSPPPSAVPPPAAPPAAVSPPPAAPVAMPPSVRPLGLVVTVTLGTGKAETFSREIDKMEILSLPDGRIHMIHLVLVTGGERNTHVWYNFARVAKLSYRFITPEGRAMVAIRTIQPYASSRELSERLEPLAPGEYR
ncbi:MAG: hypothetical protein V3V62_09690 [bacterium]